MHAIRTLMMLVALSILKSVWPAVAQSALFVTTTDFETGSTAFVPAGANMAEVNQLLIHSDALVRYKEGKIYVINRLGQDNIIVLDPSDLTTPEIQFSVGNGTNPYDIEIVNPEKAYVSRYDSPELLIVNPMDGSHLGTLDLSPFADDDGLPEMAQMVLMEPRLYIACQLLDRNATFTPAPHGLLLVVDTATDQLVDTDPSVEGIQGWELAAGNPSNLIGITDKLVIAETASFFDTEGGIEVIDLSIGTSEGLVVSEKDLEGDIMDIALVTTRLAYAVVSDENFENSVRPVDLLTGHVGDPLAGHSGGFIPSLVVDGDRLIVPDRGTFEDPTGVGLLIYDAPSGELLAGPINTGLPPNSIAVLGDIAIPTSIETMFARRTPEANGIQSIFPNPFNSIVSVSFEIVTSTESTQLSVHDLLGQPIRTVLLGLLPSGFHTVLWDGRDSRGLPAASGAYIIQLHQGGWSQSRKLMLLK